MFYKEFAVYPEYAIFFSAKTLKGEILILTKHMFYQG